MPWCPKCGSEYRDGFTECASCGVKLVDKLTDEQKKQAEMEERRDMVLPEGMSRPVVVFTAKNRLEAESIEDMLRDNDIPVFDRPAAFRQIQSYSGADARFGVELVVDASQTARARQLIDEMQTELSELERRVLMAGLEGRTPAQTAQELGLPAKNVANALARARRKLRGGQNP